MNIEGEENFDLQILKDQGEFIKDNLNDIARQLRLLKDNGWDYQGGLYEIICYKDIALDKAKQELKRLRIYIEPMEIEEY